jgi:hypothetical protein
MLAHNVYFTLKDRSQEKIDRLVAACNTYLTGHPGTRFFFAGTLEKDLRRPVNDLDFDVALVIVFEDRASHDVYQNEPRHNEFIALEKDNWDKVRVFDAIC